MAVEFAVFLPPTKSFNVLAIYCSKAYGVCNELSQNSGWRTRCTRAASYFIDNGSHFPYILYGEQEGADPQRGVALITSPYNASRPLHAHYCSLYMFTTDKNLMLLVCTYNVLFI